MISDVSGVGAFPVNYPDSVDGIQEKLEEPVNERGAGCEELLGLSARGAGVGLSADSMA